MFDAHIHLQDCKANLTTNKFGFWCNATSPDDWERVLSFSSVIRFIGIHPWFAEKINGDWEEKLRDILEKENIGIGEIGLDKACKNVSFEKQMVIFDKQVCLALEYNVPFSVHCVRAFSYLFDVIIKKKITVPYMIHSFCGDEQELETALMSGAYISISPRQVKAERMFNMIKKIPLEKLLIETDFPNVPRNFYGEKYSEILQFMYERTAEIKKVDFEVLTDSVEKNGKIFTDRIIAG